MAQQPNEFPQLTTKDVCIKMGLSPVSGSYERALCNYLGIFTPTVNNSWIQTLYPAVLNIYNQLQNQTYTGVSISQYTITPTAFDINPPFNVAGILAYSYQADGFFPGLSSMGLYVYNDTIFDYVFIPTNIISWLSAQFILYLQTSAGDDLQTQQIVANGVADAALAVQVATLNSVVSPPAYNNAPSVTLNASAQLSTTKRTRVSYTVSIATALSLLNLNANGQVFLEISSNGTTWTTINSAGTTKALSVGVTVGLNDTVYHNIQGEVPVGWFRRLRTVTSGGATVAFVSGQEVQY